VADAVEAEEALAAAADMVVVDRHTVAVEVEAMAAAVATHHEEAAIVAATVVQEEDQHTARTRSNA
jgi:hypothetical protein